MGMSCILEARPSKYFGKAENFAIFAVDMIQNFNHRHHHFQAEQVR